MRALRNILRLPRRTVESLRRRGGRGAGLQRQADRYARENLTPALAKKLGEVPGNTSDRKCRLLFYLASTTQASGCIVEIGAFKGKSTAWLAEVARRSGRRLVSIDPHLLDSLAEFQRTVARFDIAPVATIHRALSHDIGKTWKEPIGFLWIDGGHDYPIVRQDVDDFAPHVTPGGVVVFDDVDAGRFPGVVQAVRETLGGDNHFEDLGMVKTFAVFRRK